MKFSDPKQKIMDFLDEDPFGAAPALQIAALKSIPLFELEMGLDELKQEGRVIIRGGDPLYKQVVIKRRGPLTTFTCKCGNCAYEMHPFYEKCPKCGRWCWHAWRVGLLMASFLAGAALAVWLVMHHG